jgi:hypothetical protein
VVRWAAALCLLPLASAALPLAGSVPDSNNDGIPDLYDVYNRFKGTSFTSNSQLPTPIADDQTFTFGPTAGAILISSTASYENAFGYYTNDNGSEQRTTLFSGVTGFEYHEPFQFAPIGVTGSVGLFLDANGNTIWHSESDRDSAITAVDHLVAYVLGDIDILTSQGMSHVTNGILLGWEDLNPGDKDYDDLVAVVGDVTFTSVPEPATGHYLGAALVGYGLYRRGGRRARRKASAARV